MHHILSATTVISCIIFLASGAWPELALAYKNPRPGQRTQAWLGSGLALAQAMAFVREICQLFLLLHLTAYPSYLAGMTYCLNCCDRIRVREIKTRLSVI